jgi:hypothetical protein
LRDDGLPDEFILDKHEPVRNRRIRILAKYLTSRRYSRKLKGRYKTLQMIVENEKFIREKATLLESMLRREASIYDEVRYGKGRICSLRRNTMYCRLFHSYGLTIQMISWLFNVSPSTIKANLGAAYRERSHSSSI